MLFKYACYFLFFFYCSLTTVYAQQQDYIRGKVLDQHQKPVGNATVQLNGQATSSLADGSFMLERIKPGTYSLVISALGFQSYRQAIQKNAAENLSLEISLLEQINQLEDVYIEGKSATQQVREQPIRAVVIDTRAVSVQATSLTDLMNRSTGIRIRQNGGLGSNPEISVNGFQGKAVKYFKDGIPLDYLGNGYNISALPLEVLERVEVYKGVLPVSLGADALGGAVNLVTPSSSASQVHAFYEIGSFQTHRLGLLARKTSKDQRWAYGTEIFFNHSDNNYKALVGVRNPETANLEYQRLPMFHNAFENYYGEVYASIKNRSWVDELRFSMAAFNLKRQQQHPALMTDAYGAVLAKQQTAVPTMRYKKTFLDGRLSIDQFAAYNRLQTERIDTLKGRYDWYGNFTPDQSIGESRLASASKVYEKQLTLRTHITYRLNTSTKMDFNYVFTQARRNGSDPLGPKIENTDIDILSLSSNYQKQVLGLSLDNQWFDNKLQQQLMGKFYMYTTSGLQNTWFATPITDVDFRKVKANYWGIADAVKYQLNATSWIRASAEYAYRLPEREELFGNNIFVVPNFELKPEKSLNFNLGFQQQLFPSFSYEVNGFYRRTKDLILLVPIQAPNAQYQNQENVKGYGFDIDLSYRLLKHYKLNANATWQNLRLFGIEDFNDLWKNNARLRNTPYFFANAGVQSDYSNLLGKNDKLNVFFNYNFMREFYLETIPKDLEPGGFLGLSGSANLNSNIVIPNQHLLNAGFTYKLPSGQIYIATEVRNILDKDLYDYYRVQRAGRSFHLKLSYQL